MGYKPNIVQSSTNPSAGTSSATFVMMGLAIAFTPKENGSIMVICAINASINASASTSGTQIQAMFGTGTAPVNGAAVTGTVIGVLGEVTRYAATNKNLCFGLNGIVTGLTVGTTYWFDYAVKELGGTGTSTLTNNSYSISEQ